MASLGSRIIFSEYNAIQSTVSALLGPISGLIPIGTGYGQTVIVSEQYPFSNPVITNVSRATQATITTNLPHNFTSGEIIFIDNISDGMVELNDRYVTVVTVTPLTFTINLNTSTFTTWTVGQTGRIQQFVVSANQFNRLRQDLARVRTHQTNETVLDGTAVGQLPVITRGSLIQYDVYDSYFNLANTSNTQRFFLGELTSAQPSSSPVRFTSDWNGTLTFTLEIEWPSLNAVRQFFNTGGYVQFDINATGASTSNSRDKDLSWTSILNTTPVNYGATNNTNMGLRPGTWTTAGFYNADAFDREIFYVTGSGAYATNYLLIQHRALTERKIRWTISIVDVHTNIFAQAVTADISIAFLLFYTVGGVTLSYPFSNIIITPSTIQAS
jgi:hypothetical protein